MILTCPKCANRYHIDLPSKTSEILASCPSCAHRWLVKKPLAQSFLLDDEMNSEGLVEKQEAFWDKLRKHQRIIVLVAVLSIATGYILQPLLKSGFKSLFSLLKVQEMQENPLTVENIFHSLDEKTKMVTISWELKNNITVSQDLKAFRIQIFHKCPKDEGDCLVKEIKFKPNKDIILPKEILRFEHGEKFFTHITKIVIFP